MSGIYFSFNQVDAAAVNVTIIGQFDEANSWVKPESKLDEVLSHEQLHFDISELNARLLRKFFVEQTFTYKMDLTLLFKRCYNESMQKLRRMQNEYDTQTENGTNLSAQKSWETKFCAGRVTFATNKK